VKVSDSNFQIVSCEASEKGSQISVSVAFGGALPSASAKLILAVYDESGRMIACHCAENVDLSASYQDSFSSASDFQYVKAFVLSGNLPLCRAIKSSD
jgi:hypothetical protein